MSARRTIGICLMVALAGVFLVWSLQDAAMMPDPVARMVFSGLLGLAIFAAWRLLVWRKPPR